MFDSVDHSPLVRQYLALREAAGGSLLAFQLGGFFQFWGLDAKVVAQVCDLAPRQRRGLPMCLFPADARFHDPRSEGDQAAYLGSSTPYFEAIAAAGYSVAIAVETGFRDGFMQREIVGRIKRHRLTPYRSEASLASTDTF